MNHRDVIGSFASLDAELSDLVVDTFAEYDESGFIKKATITLADGVTHYEVPELLGDLTQLERETSFVDQADDLGVLTVRRKDVPPNLFPLSGRERVKLPSLPDKVFAIDLSRTNWKGDMFRIGLKRTKAIGIARNQREQS